MCWSSGAPAWRSPPAKPDSRASSRSRSPPHAPAPLLQWAALIEQPAREVAALIAQPAKPVESQALEDGWLRYARADAKPRPPRSRRWCSRAGSTRAPRVRSRCPSRSHCPGAVIRARSSSSASCTRTTSTNVRTNGTPAPRSGPVTGARWRPRSPRCRTSCATRHAGATGRRGRAKSSAIRAKARELYAVVLPTDNWYAAHAAARLDRKLTPRLEPLALSDAEIDALAAEPAFVRTRELLRCEMDAEATAEWRAACDDAAARAAGAGRGPRLPLGLA